jgi:hypothetical protein
VFVSGLPPTHAIVTAPQLGIREAEHERASETFF